MNWQELNDKIYEMQRIHGHPLLDPIISGGCFENPKIAFVFMNPTARNVASSREWASLKAPWIGTKNIWKLFHKLGYLDSDINDQIQKLKPYEWDYDFAQKVYDNIKRERLYFTNLAKCTQLDAKHLSDDVFRSYLNIFLAELELINPEIIVTFGNQVSSIILDQEVYVSKQRGQSFELKHKDRVYKIFPTFYPVGQGQRNLPFVIEDIQKIKDKI
ncbi:MAG TPA: uracil-DNA glycosylase family protein [Candidatus Dojkabacteria bacterium]|nr:uracil-DNA glycosylase family protein [Candidatus Dojkabacteria bacterium]